LIKTSVVANAELQAKAPELSALATTATEISLSLCSVQ